MDDEIRDASPLCVLFVTKGTKGDRLLFKYPFNYEDTTRIYRNMKAIKIEEDLFTSKAKSPSSLMDAKGHLVGLSDDIMAFLFAVRQEVCSQPLEVKINDVRFVCYPMHLNNSTNNNNATNGVSSNNHGNNFLSSKNDAHCETSLATPKNVMHRVSASLPQLVVSSNNGHRTEENKCRCYAGNALPPTNKTESRRKRSKTMNEDKILLFNIVFGLHGNARRSVVQSYQDLSKRIAIALKHEENRCQYLTLESKIMMDCIEDMQSPPYSEKESHFKLHLERSKLAYELKSVFDDIKQTGIVQIFINEWIKVSFCLPQRVHCYPGIGSIEPDTIQRFIDLIKPYHGVLLLKEVEELLDDIPPDGSPDLSRLLKFVSPLVSFQTLAADTDLALTLVFRLVGHLVYWGKATIIYPLCETNVYRISPTAVLDSSDLHENFAQNFPSNPCLFSALSEFSAPTSLADFTNPLTFDPQEQAERVRIVVWLLKNFMLIQLRTYVYLSIDKSPTDAGSPPKRENDLNEIFQSSLFLNEDYKLIRNLLTKHLTSTETDYFLNFYAKQVKDNRSFYDDVRLFCKLSKYFNGQHHLEDIMFRENLRRHELMRILTEFNAILITCSYEDELSAIFIKIVLDQRDLMYDEISEYTVLRRTIEKLKEAGVEENLKTQMDIGCSFYVQAVVPNPRKICIKIGYGFFAEFTLDEALPFIDKKVEFLNHKVKDLTHQACSIKAKIKIVLEGLRELQNLDHPSTKSFREVL